MVCHECGQDDKKTLPDDLPIADVLRLCKNWRCDLCSRTPEQVQADFEAEAAKNPHKSAHDWGMVPNGARGKHLDKDGSQLAGEPGGESA